MSHDELTTPQLENRSYLMVRTLIGGMNVASAVYGTVITLAVIGAWYADKTSGALETLLSVVATLVVFWVAHAYAHVVGQGLPVGDSRWHIKHAFQHDWPIVQSGFLPILVLGFGELGVMGERVAMLIALGAGILLLSLFCLTMARAAGRNWQQALGITGILVALGILVVVLEINLG